MGTRVLAALAVCSTFAFADVVIYQDGAPDPFAGGIYTGIQDTMVINNLGGQRGDNYGGRINLEFGPVQNPTAHWGRRSLFRFDLSSFAGQFASINSVTLRLTEASASGSAGYNKSGTASMHRMSAANASWREGTLSGGQQFPTASWLQKGRFESEWAGGTNGAGISGVDYVSTPLATAAWVPSTTVLDLVFNDVSVINDWLTGINSGVIIRSANEGVGSRWNFHSSEGAILAFRPQLIIDYTPLNSDPDPVPEPSTLLLITSALVAFGIWRRRG